MTHCIRYRSCVIVLLSTQVDSSSESGHCHPACVLNSLNGNTSMACHLDGHEDIVRNFQSKLQTCMGRVGQVKLQSPLDISITWSTGALLWCVNVEASSL